MLAVRNIVLMLLFGFVCFVGCGPKVNLDGVVPVAGTLTLDSQPFEGADVTFMPQASASGSETRSGRAVTAADGTFNAMTLQTNDGLYPGEYKVVVSKITRVPSVPEEQAAKLAEAGKAVPPDKETEHAPKVYTDPETTPLTVTIGSKGEKELKIELKSK